MLCTFELTNNITRYLYGFLQSLYCSVAQSTTFHSGFDAVQAIEAYRKRGRLQASTLFVTIEFEDLDTIFPHIPVIQTFQRFLHDHVSNEQQTVGLSHETIVTLIELVLHTQYFIYDNKLYQQTKGGNTNSPLIKLLTDIYLFYWQQDLLKILHMKKEIFGR